MNKIVVGCVAGAVVVGAAGFGTLVYPQMRVKHEVDAALAQLPKEIKASYRGLSYSLFTGKLSIDGIEVIVDDSGSTLTAKAANLTMRGIDRTKVGELQGSGITVEDGGGSLRIAAESLAGEKIETADGKPLAVENGAVPAMNIKRIALSGITVTVPGETVSLREIALGDLVQQGTVPVSMSLGMHGLAVEAKTLPDADARETLAALGYTSLSLNFDLAYEHAIEAQRLTIKNAAIGGDGVGQLALTARLGGIPAIPQDNPELMLAAAQAATLESMELRYDDASLAKRVFKLAATQSEMDEAQWKASLMEKLNEGVAQGDASPLTREVLNSAAAFLADPKSLTLQVKPAQPIPLMRMMAGAGDPNSLIQATGMAVFANK